MSSFHGEGRGSGDGGGRGGSRRRELRPEDVPDKPVSLRRIGRLFIPYRLRLSLLLGLIVFGSILSVASPFLLREALDKGILEHDLELLTWMVAGMIALAIINGVIGVAQTWISNEVGQRVMHDLRAAVYAHLQRMSLAFFTRTRSGEVQARIAYDIGGIDDVVTSTATSTVSTVATVAATVVAMFALSWQLTVFSLILLPFFVWLTRRVGNSAGASSRCARDASRTCPRSWRSPSRCRASCSAKPWAARASSWIASRGSPASSRTWRCARAWRGAGGWPRCR